MGKINVLSFAVANLIAAGEVVDRPASVVKELMENSIDAGSSHITVEIQNGGTTFIRVTDDGCGMTPEDLPISIRRHATSKIRTAEDLDGIATLGFRGEALAATAAVSDLRIISKTRESDFGARLECSAGEIKGVFEQGCPDGTSVIVEHLFSNVPARRKFLKKDITESMAVMANVEKVALSHPEIAFRLIIDGNVKLDTAGDGILNNTIYAIFGKDFASRVIPINSEQDGITVRGIIGRTDLFKANRNYENFFINGRFVKSKTMAAALEQAFTSYMPPERFPVCVLYLDIPPAKVDVNVHPAKLEVKFSNEKPVFEAVYYTVRTALESNETRPSMQLDVSVRARRENVFADQKSQYQIPIPEIGSSLQKRQMTYQDVAKMPSQPQTHMTAEQYRNSELHDQQKTISAQNPFERKIAFPKEKNIPQVSPAITPSVSDNSPIVPPMRKVEKATEKLTETKNASMEVLTEDVTYRIVGEVFHSYVIVETGDKLLLIDKHAAHERILFEGLKANLKEVTPVSQMLLIPIEVMLTSAEVQMLCEYREELEKIGFTATFGKNAVTVSSIPEGIETGVVPDMLGTMAGRLLDATGDVKLTKDIIFEKALYQAACKAAVKAGREYADGHIEWIIGQLMKIPDITFCPHGRPVALELSHKMLDKQFDRLGF